MQIPHTNFWYVEKSALSTLIIDSPTPTRYKIMTTNHSHRFVLKPQQNKRATLAACTAATVCSFTSTEICHQQTILIFAREKNGKLSGAVCISFWPWEKTIFTIRCLSTLSSQHLPTFFLYFSAKFLLRSFLMLLDIVCPVRWLECVCIVHFWCLLTGLNVSRKYKKKNVLNWPTSNWTMNGVAFSILWLPCCKLQLISSTEVEGISQRLQ